VQVDTSSGVVSTLAGSGETVNWECQANVPTCGGFADGTGDAAAFRYVPSGALTPDETYFIVADYWNHKVRAVNRETKQVTTLASLDGIAGPADVVMSPDGGTLYVSARLGQRIVAVTVPPATAGV